MCKKHVIRQIYIYFHLPGITINGSYFCINHAFFACAFSSAQLLILVRRKKSVYKNSSKIPVMAIYARSRTCPE